MADFRPALLFYCQHSLGIGHLTRSFALASALREHFRVHFLNGGRLPQGVHVPAEIECIDLPALGMDDGHTIVRRDGGRDVLAAWAERRAIIHAAVTRIRPAVLLVELFPFGRKKFAGEILPMIRAARRQPGSGARVVCSVRDILVSARPDQQRHDDRAAWLADRYFDAVLVHTDPALARFEESFRPRRPMRTPVFNTGYVIPARPTAPIPARGEHLLLSAGGGIVGEGLFRAVIDALSCLPSAPPLRVIAGPFLPEPAWAGLRELVSRRADIELVRHVPDMVAEMRVARASISQCGYNSALDIIASGVPALVAPYETEDENEQRVRAERLSALDAVRVLPPVALTPQRLADAIAALLRFTPRPAALKLDGAVRSAALLDRLVHDQGRSVA